MDQATQEAMAKQYSVKHEKQVSQMTESELIQLVKKACREAIDEDVSEYTRTVEACSVHIPKS